MELPKENSIPWHFVQISKDGNNDTKFKTKNIKATEELQKRNPNFLDDLKTPCYLNTLQQEHELQIERKAVKSNSHTPSPRTYNTPNKKKEIFCYPMNIQLGGHTSSLNVAPYYADEKCLYTCDSTVNSPFLYDNTHYHERNFTNGLVNDNVCCNTTSPKVMEASAYPVVSPCLNPIRMHPTNCNTTSSKARETSANLIVSPSLNPIRMHSTNCKTTSSKVREASAYPVVSPCLNPIRMHPTNCNTTSSKARETSANLIVSPCLNPIGIHPTNCNPNKICLKHQKYLETVANTKVEKNTPFLYRSGLENNNFSNYSDNIILDLKTKKQSFLNWIAPRKPKNMEPMPPCPTARLCWPYNDSIDIQKMARFQNGSGPIQQDKIFSCNNPMLNTECCEYDFIREPKRCEIPCSLNSAHSTHLFKSPKLRVSTIGPFVEKNSNEGHCGPCSHKNCVLSKMFHCNPLSKANDFTFTLGQRCSLLLGQKNISPPFLYPPRPIQRIFPNLFRIATNMTSTSRKKKKGLFPFLKKEENNPPPCLHGGLLGALEDISIMGTVFGNFFLDAVLVTMDTLTHDGRQKNTSDIPMCQCASPSPRYPQGGDYSDPQDGQTRATGCWVYDAVNNFMDARMIPMDDKTDVSPPTIPTPKTQVTGIKIIDKVNNFLDDLYPQPKHENKKVYKKDPYNALRRCFETNSAPSAKPWNVSQLLLPFAPCRKLYTPEYADSCLTKLCSGQTDSMIPRCPQHIKYTNFDLIPPEENEDNVQHMTYPLYHNQQTTQSPSITPVLVYNNNY